MNTLLDRFCRYVRIHTQADETATTYPSSPGQLELGRLLTRGTAGAGPARRRAGRARHRPGHHPRHRAARRPDHRLDRPRRYLAGNHRPQRQADRPRQLRRPRHRAARRPDQGDPRRRQSGAGGRSRARRSSPPTARRCSAPTTRPASPSSWRRRRSCWPSPEIPHGPIRVCFTCDEEIGHGVDHVDLKKLGAARRLHARRRRPGRDRRRNLLRRPGRR